MAATTKIARGRSRWYAKTADPPGDGPSRQLCSSTGTGTSGDPPLTTSWRNLKLREGMGTNPTFTPNRVRPGITRAGAHNGGALDMRQTTVNSVMWRGHHPVAATAIRHDESHDC